MATLKPETGLVIRYRYLWQRQALAGEETGRKARPVCVVIPIGAKGADVVLFPLTTQPPCSDRLAVQVPETERRRLQLKGNGPAWIILDEGNRDELPNSYHLEPVTVDPVRFHYGVFSPAFMRVVLTTLAQAIRAQQLKVVSRGE
jgi:hypothetical protein